METGLRIIVQVDGFHDAKDWMYRLLKSGAATCSICDKPAVQIWWNDAAEWYFHCAGHYDTAQQWSGSTRWNPAEFSKSVIPGKIQEWIATLEPDEQTKVRLETFDATDYYALLPDDHYYHNTETVLSGTRDWGKYVNIYRLKDGRYAYEKSFTSPGFGYHYGLKAPFVSEAACLEDARKDEVE